jgi:hypothetical protein
MPDADLITAIFDNLGIAGLGWVVALFLGVALGYVLRWIAREQSKWHEIEQERSDKVLDALNRNTEVIARHSVAFELITRDLQEKLKELIYKGGLKQ